jgi:hypothetical protein
MTLCYKCLQPIPNANKHGLHQKCFQELFKTNDDFTNLAMRPGESTDHTIVNSSFFQGTFKKYSATLGTQEYILKAATDEYPELPKAEFLSNQIGSSLQLAVADYYLIKFLNETDCFVTRNFMSDYAGGNLIHIYHLFKPEENFDLKTILRIILDKTGRLHDVRKFIDICLFDALIGNHDRHGRNIAFIQTSEQFILSPAYDNPSYLAIEDEKFLAAYHEPRGKISTTDCNEPIMHNYIQELKALGYHAEISAFYQRINLDKINLLIQNSLLSTKRKQAFIDLIRRRFNAIFV